MVHHHHHNTWMIIVTIKILVMIKIRSGLATWSPWNGGTIFGWMRDSLPGWSTRCTHLQYQCPQDDWHDYHSLNITFPWFSGCGRGATRLGDGRTVLGEQVDAGSQGWHTCGFILVNLGFQQKPNFSNTTTIIIILFIFMVNGQLQW